MAEFGEFQFEDDGVIANLRISFGGGAHRGPRASSLLLRRLVRIGPRSDGNHDENPKQCASNALSTFILYCYTREWWDQYIDTPEAYTK